MSQLLTLRAAMIDAIKQALPSFEVAGHMGRFSATDLNQFLVKAPAVRVAILGLSDTSALGPEGDHLAARVKLAIYVVTRDQAKRLGREEMAVAAVEALCLLALGNRWGLDFTLPAEAPKAQTIFSKETLDKGVALWAIELDQPVRLAPDDDGSQGPEGSLKEMWLGIAPEIGIAHRDAYIGPLKDGTDV